MKHSKYTQNYLNLNKDDVDRLTKNVLENRYEMIRHFSDLKLIKKYIKPGSLLDFPIGTGRIYPHFIDTHKVYGAEISIAYIENARSKYPHIKDNFFIDDLMNTSTKLKFDNIICYRAIGGISDSLMGLTNLSKLLNFGGRLIFNINKSLINENDLNKHLIKNNLKVIDKINIDSFNPDKIKKSSFLRKYVRSISIKLINKGYLSDNFWMFIINNYPFTAFCTYIVEKK